MILNSKMEKKIINEINRHRELMGLQSINESQENKILLTEESYRNGELPESILKDVTNPNGSTIKLSVYAEGPYKDMVAAYKEETGRDMNSSQGYRLCGSEDRGCKDGFTQWCAWIKWNRNPSYAADPRKGCKSNHGLGCAVDVKHCKSGSPTHTWLKQNASRFGFKPYSRESWHWEHAGCISKMKSGSDNDAKEEIDTEVISQPELEVGADESNIENTNDVLSIDGSTIENNRAPWDIKGAIEDKFSKIGDNFTKAIESLKKLT